MTKVITYGTYDLLHQGHINLLRRAKELGDYLIVGVTSDSFDRGRGKLNVRNNVLERVEAVKATGYADEVIIEDYVGQKIDDIQKYDVDIFAIGSDWVGKFDYLNEYCKVVYLPRTEGISSTQLREETQDICKIGIIGSGRIARRFVPESKVVSGAEVVSVLNPDKAQADAFAHEFGLEAFDDFDSFVQKVDAVYIASPHLTHYDYAKRSLEAGKHVLCEIPFVLSAKEAEELYRLADEKGLVLLEASKTAAWIVQAYENVPLKTHDKTFLRDVPESMYKRHRDEMPPRFARRAEHFYGGHKRVREGITAWETGNLEWFGSLSKASCDSSIHNYECGSPELQAIYQAMLTTDGIYGGRFSGAGFKGACIALVDPAKKESIEKEITEKYLAQFPQYRESFQVCFCMSDDGARFV